jgi:hypothetical protein
MAVRYLVVLAVLGVFVGAHELVHRRRRSLRVLAIGAIASYLYVGALAFVLYSCHGVEGRRAWYAVDEVLPGFDAAGKLKPGDRIVAIDGMPMQVPSTATLVDAVQAGRGAPATLVVIRDGVPLAIVVQPKRDVGDHGAVWVLGIRPTLAPELSTDVSIALPLALRYPIDQVHELVPSSEILGQEPADPGGPKRMVDVYRKRADVWVAWKLAMVLATYTLVVLIGVDLWRAIALVRARRRT